MTLLDVSGHRLAKFSADDNRPQFKLRTLDGQYLHFSIEAGLTRRREYAWQGNRDQMHKALELVPEAIRSRLIPYRVGTPRVAGRA